MEINIVFDHGKLTVSPDPAIVRRGTAVNWRFRVGETSLRFRVLQWTVYFNQGSPFRDKSVVVTDTSDTDGNHAGSSQPISADQSGDYKYGVRVVDTTNQHTIEDIDPRLIVE